MGIIAAIAVPTIGGLIERQRVNAAEATYDTIVDAAVLYADGSATVFTLQDIEDDDFVDLKDNVYSLTTGGVNQTSAIYVKVVGSTVTFYSDAGAATGSNVYINTYLVYTT